MEENIEQTPVNAQVEEQLSQPEVNPVQEAVVEPVVVEEKLEVVENKTEEIVEEKLEAVVEEKVEVAKEELNKEAVESDILKTKEELGIIREVREELVNLYSSNKELSVAKEQLSIKVDDLSKENLILKSDVEKLTSELMKYKEVEEKLALKVRAERLEKLSASFKVLGQEKSVEQLSEKDEETLSEFEKIVSAAIEKLEDSVKEAPAVTSFTQADSVEAPKVEQKASEVVAKAKPVVKQTNEDFFKKLCGNLQKEQKMPGTQRAKVF